MGEILPSDKIFHMLTELVHNYCYEHRAKCKLICMGLYFSLFFEHLEPRG